MRVSRQDESAPTRTRLGRRLVPAAALALTAAGVYGTVSATASEASPPSPATTTSSPSAGPSVTASVTPAATSATTAPASTEVPAAFAAAGPVGTPLPGGRPRFVVSMIGGGYNAYWVRLAQYTFTPGSGGTGTVQQDYWMWYQNHFTGDARRNKVATGYVTTGCRAACAVRTPRGFQPGAGPMGSLTGRYRFDRYGRVVVEWPGRRVEAWQVRSSRGTVARLTLHHTSLGGLAGDALGSTASFSTGATRDEVAATVLTGVQRVASYGDGGRTPVRTSVWGSDVVRPMQRCGGPGSGAACLLRTDAGWRSAIVVPRGLGRRAFWQNQLQGSDGDRGPCFGPGGGHTVAMLQAIDDRGRFAGFVGAEASLNGRSRHNAVVGELILT